MPAAFVPLTNGKKKPSLPFKRGWMLPLHLQVLMLATAVAEIQRLVESPSSFRQQYRAGKAEDLYNNDKTFGKHAANVHLCVIVHDEEQQKQQKLE